MAALLLGVCGAAAAQVPETIAYQGYLTSNDGTPLEGRLTLAFRLYDASTGGAAVWAESQAGVPVQEGIFSVHLGQEESLGKVNFEHPLWLAVSVDGDELSPRVALSAAPYALSVRGVRFEPAADPTTEGPNVIAGYDGNRTEGAVGATISGGGDPDLIAGPAPNEVTSDYGSIGGGAGNVANFFGTVSGGRGNTAGSLFSTVAGGVANKAGEQAAAVGGGIQNVADGLSASVGGGNTNTALGSSATVPGGSHNHARGSHSFAAGHYARAIHDGTFVWSDDSQSFEDSLLTTAEHQFLIRATGGVGIGTNAPTAPLTVAGVVESTEGGFKLPDGTVLAEASDLGGAGSANTWQLGGNSGTDPQTQFLGTTDEAPLELRVNGARALRIEPAGSSGLGLSPNVIGGYSGNSVSDGVFGATISGGGHSTDANRVTGSVGTISGGSSNEAGGGASIGGGSGNRAAGDVAAIGGGSSNSAAGAGATISGGIMNAANGIHASVGGGVENAASAQEATVAGGVRNTARQSWATVGGGSDNISSGLFATVPGGLNNHARGQASIAAGFYARAIHDGTFVWSDDSQSFEDSLLTTAEHQFLIRAAGGVGIGTNAPTSPLTVAGVVESTEGGFKLPDGTVLDDASDIGGNESGDTWQLGGNDGTDPETQFLGTTDKAPLEIKVGKARVMRFEPAADPGDGGPNVIGGWNGNRVDEGVVGATIGGGGAFDAGIGGVPNQVTADYGTIGGGIDNVAGNTWATVGGGFGNTASGAVATVGGGINNTAGANQATVGGGDSNTASGVYSTVSGGLNNRTTAPYAAVPGGQGNVAGGQYSFAAGRSAKVRDATATGDTDGDEGTFVWADSGPNVFGGNDFVSSGPDQFLIRASGGVGIGTNAPRASLHLVADSDTKAHLLLEEDDPDGYARLRMKNNSSVAFWDLAAGSDDTERLNIFTSRGRGNVMSLRATGDPLVMYNGARLTAGGAWTNASSRFLKTEFRAVDVQTVLAKLVRMPVLTWRYNAETRVRHIGPTAQDFAAAFGLGNSDESIATVDADGVALASIQAVHELVQQQKAEIEALRTEVEMLQILIRQTIAASRATEARPR